MLGVRASVMVALLSLAVNGAGAAGCGTTGGKQMAQNNQQSNNQQSNIQQLGNDQSGEKIKVPGQRPSERGNVSGIKILSQGAYNSLTESFVAVARDAETYAELRRLDNKLPPLSVDAFDRAAVVAAFLGERRTGGYGVEITRTADGTVHLAESSPPPDSLSAQVITTPYTIASVMIEKDRPLMLELAGTWQASMRPYRVASGEFTMTGGFAGRSEEMRLEGGLKVMRYGNLATFIFDLKTTGAAKARELKEAATGIVKANGEVHLARFNAGSLVELPANLLGAKGQFTKNEGDLTLTFESLPSNIADGYQGRGRLTAVATGPPPPKRAMNKEEVM